MRRKTEDLIAEYGAKEVLSKTGIPDEFLKKGNGPCPVCGGKDRFRFDEKKGPGTSYCNQCGPYNAFTLVQAYFGLAAWKDAAAKIDEAFGISGGSYQPETPEQQAERERRMAERKKAEEEEERKKREKARYKLRKVNAESAPAVRGDAVDQYLIGRGLYLPSLPKVLRCGRMTYYEPDPKAEDVFNDLGEFDVMLAEVSDPSGKKIGFHRTYIKGGGKADVPKAKKLMTGTKSMNGGAIRLFDPVGGAIALAEGIETALAVHLRTGLPVWATIANTFLEEVILPDFVTKVFIFGDLDESGAGQKSADAAALRFFSEGRKVKVFLPPTVEEDWHDIWVRNLKEGKYRAAA